MSRNKIPTNYESKRITNTENIIRNSTSFVIRKVFMEEAGLLGKLGINWKLLISQAVNFFILLVILRAFVYKPLLSAVKKRNEKIKEGLEKAREADIRLKEIDVIAKKKLREAENESLEIVKNTELKAKEMEQVFRRQAEERQKEAMKQIELERDRQKEESQKAVFGEAANLVRRIIAKTVEMKPEEIDESLIRGAIQAVKKTEI